MFDKFYVGRDVMSSTNNGKYKPVSRVTLVIDDERTVTAGDDTGREIVANCPYATQEMVDALLASMKGFEYQSYEAADANIDPSAELGDGVTVDGVYSVVANVRDNGGGYASISAPGEAELEDEYPIEGPLTQIINRGLKEAGSRITKTAEEIRMEVSETKQSIESGIVKTLENYSTHTQTAEAITSKVSKELENYSTTGQINAKLEAYSTTEQTAAAIASKVSKELENYSTTGQIDAKLAAYSTTEQTAAAIASKVSKELENYSTTGQINAKLAAYSTTEQTAEAIASKISKELANYSTTGQIDAKLAAYSTTEQTAAAIASKVSKELENYSTTGQINAKLAAYSTTEQTAEAIASKISKELANYSTTGQITAMLSAYSTIEQTEESIASKVSKELANYSTTGQITAMLAAYSTTEQTEESIASKVSKELANYSTTGQIIAMLNAYSTIEQTEAAIASKVSKELANYSTTGQITAMLNAYSTIEQTEAAIASKVSKELANYSTTGQIDAKLAAYSTRTQTADEIKDAVKGFVNGEEVDSKIELGLGGLSLSASSSDGSASIQLKNGNAVISSNTFKLKVDAAEVSGVLKGTGNNLELEGMLTLRDPNGTEYGAIGSYRGSTGTESTYGAVLMNINYNGGFVATDAGSKMMFGSHSLYCAGNGINASSEIKVASDRTLKNSISYDLTTEERAFANLRPCSFIYNNDKDKKRHWGFVAQDFVQGVEAVGMDADTLAVIGYHNGKYSIGYGEVAALNTHMIQRLMSRVELIERKLGG